MPAYLELKLSWELFQRAAAPERRRTRQTGQIARRQQQLEAAILSSREAEDVRVGDAELHARLNTLAARYASARRIDCRTERRRLNQASLVEVVLRDLRAGRRCWSMWPAKPNWPATKTPSVTLRASAGVQPAGNPHQRHILVTFNNSARAGQGFWRLDKVRRTLVDEDSFCQGGRSRYSHWPHLPCRAARWGTPKRAASCFPNWPSAFGMDAGEVSGPDRINRRLAWALSAATPSSAARR